MANKCILYVFPHPDDESFGPAPVIYIQRQQGHEVFLLTLTRGGATKVRHKLGLTIQQMGEIRFQEMLKVEKVLGLNGMTVLDLPDSGLAEMDPRELERIVSEHIQKIHPNVVVTYPVHGISGFHDHLVMHTVVKRVFVELKHRGADYWQRLAFITIPNKVEEPMQSGTFLMKQSDKSLIDCEVLLSEKAKEAMKQALLCYDTYRETIEKSGVIGLIGDRAHFEIYREDHKPVLGDLTEALPEN